MSETVDVVCCTLLAADKPTDSPAELEVAIGTVDNCEKTAGKPAYG